MGFLDGLFSKPGLRSEPSGEGTRIADSRTGLSFVAPGKGELIQGFPETPVSPGFDGGFRLASHPVEVRLRVDTLLVVPGSPPPAPGAPPSPPPPPNAELAHETCLHHASMRTEGEPLVGVAQPWQLEQWRVDAAASTIYPLARPEGRFDMEECQVLIKGDRTRPPQAVILWKLFSTKGVTPALWSELNGRLVATMTWGGEPRKASPPAESFYVDARMELAPAAKDHATKLAAELKAASIDPKLIEEAAAAVQKFAYGSDPPDQALDAEVRDLLKPALLEPLAPPLRAALEKELADRVKTYRDFRGLHVFLDAVSKLVPGAAT